MNTLAYKLQKIFKKKKINDLNTADKIDSYLNERFIREQNKNTKETADLLDEIRREILNDPDKLKENIYNDLEKLDSWQAYATILFANIRNDPIQEKES